MMETPAERGSSAPGQEQEVRRLGEALGARIDDVLTRTTARGAKARRGTPLDPKVLESFERIGRSSTAAVASWIAGGNPEAGRETGRQAWHTYGHLAAQSAAPLN